MVVVVAAVNVQAGKHNDWSSRSAAVSSTCLGDADAVGNIHTA